MDVSADSMMLPRIHSFHCLDETQSEVVDLHSIRMPKLLTFFFNADAQVKSNEWVQHFTKQYPRGGLDATAFSISMIDNWLLRKFSGWQRRAATAATPEPERRFNLALFDPAAIETLATDLDMANRFYCYAYLVDANGFVRWRGVGAPTAEELQGLHKVTNDLLLEEANQEGEEGGSATTTTRRKKKKTKNWERVGNKNRKK